MVELVHEILVPSLQVLVQLQKEGKLLAGGIRAGSQDVVFILRLPAAESHRVVRQLLVQMPMYGHYRWEVTPLESFDEWVALVKS
jgi:hypothetical protein